jgi:hypothetical protein
VRKTLLLILVLLSVLFLFLTYYPRLFFTEGNGTQDSPFVIKTVKQFNSLSKIQTKGKFFILGNDLDFSGVELKPIKVFGGILDGNGHVIKNLKIAPNKDGNSAIFEKILPTGQIKNLTFENLVIVPGAKSSSISIFNQGEIKDCKVSAELFFKEPPKASSEVRYYYPNTVTILAIKVGGIATVNQGKIENCTFSGKIASEIFEDERLYLISGICVENEKDGTIDNCKTYGEITFERFYSVDIAGICTWNKSGGMIKNSSSSFKIKTDGNFANAAGLVFRNDGTISRSIFNGQMEGNSVAGIVYVNSKTGFVDKTGMIGSLTAFNSVCGIVESNLGRIFESFFNGEIRSYNNVNGVFYENFGKIEDVYFHANVYTKNINNIGYKLGDGGEVNNVFSKVIFKNQKERFNYFVNYISDKALFGNCISVFSDDGVNFERKANISDSSKNWDFENVWLDKDGEYELRLMEEMLKNTR